MPPSSLSVVQLWIPQSTTWPSPPRRPYSRLTLPAPGLTPLHVARAPLTVCRHCGALQLHAPAILLFNPFPLLRLLHFQHHLHLHRHRLPQHRRTTCSLSFAPYAPVSSISPNICTPPRVMNCTFSTLRSQPRYSGTQTLRLRHRRPMRPRRYY